MFCSNCGNKLDEGSVFCGNCGAEVTNFKNSKPNSQFENKSTKRNESPDDLNKRVDSTFYLDSEKKYLIRPNLNCEVKNDILADKPRLEYFIGKNTNYYFDEFHQCINNKSKPRFNFAAFFLWIYHAFYRNTWKEFFYMLYPPYLLGQISYILAMFFLSQNLVGTGSMTITGICFLIFFCSILWGLVQQIKYAKYFNIIYLHHIDSVISDEIAQENKSATKRVIASFIIFGAIVFLNKIVITSLFYF